MRSTLVAAFALLVSMSVLAKGGANNPAEVIVQSTKTIVEVRYVGVTTHLDDGEWEYPVGGGVAGVAAMNRACRDDYGPGARAATIQDMLLAESPADSWLVPSDLAVAAVESFQGFFIAVDASTGYQVGPEAPDTFLAFSLAYCNRYLTGQSSGRGVVMRLGGIGATFCDREFPAACAAPVVIPVQ